MRRGIDPTGQTADHGETGVGELIRKLLGRLHPVMSRPSRTDDGNGMLIALGQFAPDVKHDGRRVNLAQLPRVKWRADGDHRCAKLPDAFKLRRQIDNLFPSDNLIRDFIPDSFDSAQFVSSRRENAVGRGKNFQEPAQSHRPHRRKHIQRDAGFGGGHRLAVRLAVAAALSRGVAGVPRRRLCQAQSSVGSRKTTARQSLALPFDQHQKGISSSSGAEGAAFGGDAGLLERGALDPSSSPPPPPPLPPGRLPIS